jgi:hypothetical protein
MATRVEFEKLTYKNFLSTGDQPIEIDLNSHFTTLVVGANGAGKCLRGGTRIGIEFNSDESKKKFEAFMKTRKK